jgi:hypothetical protein
MSCRHVIVTQHLQDGVVRFRFRVLPPDYSGRSPWLITQTDEEFSDALGRLGLNAADESDVFRDLERDGLALRIVDGPFREEDAAYFGWTPDLFFNASSVSAAAA